MNIAIIEDEVSCAEQLKNYLGCWGKEHNILLNLICYRSGEEILSNLSHDIHVVFMDIHLSGISGMEIARRLRQSSYKGHIVFLTAHREYVFEGYHVRALDYLVKPITPEVLENCMRPVLYELKSSYYIFRTAMRTEKIPYSSIIAFTTQGHYIEIITPEHTYRQKISLKSLRQMLPEDFVQCHRTVIVNVNHIRKLDGNNLHTTNQAIYPISKKYKENIQNAFINCIT